MVYHNNFEELAKIAHKLNSNIFFNIKKHRLSDFIIAQLHWFAIAISTVICQK